MDNGTHTGVVAGVVVFLSAANVGVPSQELGLRIS
jgi:hypothetical protein